MHKLSLTILLAGAAAATACQQQQQPDQTANATQPQPRPIVPRPQPPIDRASLLAAVTEAASATASGEQMPQSVRSLDGRQFEFRIRFGCRGPATDLQERWLGWSFDAEERRIRVRAAPTIAKSDPLVGRIGAEQFEAVEGFWIPRPWLLQPVCPAAAAVQSATDGAPAGAPSDRNAGDEKGRQPLQASRATGPVPADESEVDEALPIVRRIGIAQFFTSDDARTGRRDTRAYEAAHTLAEGQAISSQGYNLVLAGRLRAIPGRGVVHCSTRGADTPPECLVSVEFLRVWIEQPDTREVIARWGGG